MKKAYFLTASLLVIAIFSRLIPHPFNFTAIGATALLSGYAFRKSISAFLIPLLALWISDLFINNILYAASYSGFTFFTQGALYIYGAFALTVIIGMGIREVSMKNVALKALISALLFFVITNFGVWLVNPIYPQNIGGLISSYVMGLPFLLNDVLGTLVYGVLLFGLYEAYLSSGMKKIRVRK